MRHKNKYRKLGRNKAARAAMFKNMCASLAQQGYVVTSEAKGKELKKYFEPLVGKAKQELTLARRRELISRMGSREGFDHLLAIAARQDKRNSGFLRLSKLALTRSNGLKQVRVEIVD